VASKTFNAPAEALTLAERAAARAGTPSTQRTPAVTYSRRAALTAAVRAACAAPPPAPVSYPTLTTAARKVTLPLTDDLHAALRVVEARYFYGRTAWLIFYALVHYTDRIEVLLRLDAEALAEQDRIAVESTRRSACRTVPLSTRAPKASRKK
jgi:hypothetical protein